MILSSGDRRCSARKSAVRLRFDLRVRNVLILVALRTHMYIKYLLYFFLKINVGADSFRYIIMTFLFNLFSHIPSNEVNNSISPAVKRAIHEANERATHWIPFGRFGSVWAYLSDWKNQHKLKRSIRETLLLGISCLSEVEVKILQVAEHSRGGRICAFSVRSHSGNLRRVQGRISYGECAQQISDEV